jgi:hypothetical protein
MYTALPRKAHHLTQSGATSIRYIHSYPFLTDHFNVTRSTSTSRFRAFLSYLSFSVTCVCRLSPFFIYHAVLKQATPNLTLTFSTGLTAPLTSYTNQLKVWKCCSCATHFIDKNWTRNLRLTWRTVTFRKRCRPGCIQNIPDWCRHLYGSWGSAKHR